MIAWSTMLWKEKRELDVFKLQIWWSVRFGVESSNRFVAILVQKSDRLLAHSRYARVETSDKYPQSRSHEVTGWQDRSLSGAQNLLVGGSPRGGDRLGSC